jgi:phosphoglycerate dehydrogenase-like enzyme
MKIVVYSPSLEFRRSVDEELFDMILQAAGEHTVVRVGSPAELAAEGADAEVLYGHLREELWPHFPRLRWLQSPSAGVESQLFPAFVESEVILTNAKGIHAPYCAEHAFALLLGLTRAIHHYARDQDARRRVGRPLIEIGGWTLGILGLGGFGREMAQRGKGFNMRVLGLDPYRSEPPPHVDELLPAGGLPDLLRRSDVVMTACPHTPETHHMIDARALRLMKPTAYLISVTRGGVVDEAALAAALRERRIAGAGLDVYEVEPLPEDSPLWALDNVLLTPHAAGISQNRPRPTIELFCDNLRRYRDGRPLRNVVDKALGF